MPVDSIKATAEVAIEEHAGLKNLAEGLKTNASTRYVPPPSAAKAQAEAQSRAAAAEAQAKAAAEAAEAREAHARILAAEAAWQASGGAVAGLPAEEKPSWWRRRV